MGGKAVRSRKVALGEVGGGRGEKERERQREPVGGEGAQTALCLLFKHTFLAAPEGEKYLSSEGRCGGWRVSGH